MSRYPITFNHLLRYDTGKPGITVPVLLEMSGVNVTAETKLDTGSTYCIFDRFFGERLGLDIEQGHPELIGTATGSFLAYGHEVTMHIEGFVFDSMVYFSANPGLKRNVLGRFGFLQKVFFGLDDYAGELYLTSNDTIDSLSN